MLALMFFNEFDFIFADGGDSRVMAIICPIVGLLIVLSFPFVWWKHNSKNCPKCQELRKPVSDVDSNAPVLKSPNEDSLIDVLVDIIEKIL
jgi:hypothetical protein